MASDIFVDAMLNLLRLFWFKMSSKFCDDKFSSE